MADGGTLAFGLRHVYPIGDSLEHVYKVLKGSDAVVYQSMRALGFDPVLYVYYEEGEQLVPQGTMVDRLIYFREKYFEEESIYDVVQAKGGILVLQYGARDRSECQFEKPELVEWVTPRTMHNCQEDAFASHGNEPTLNLAYGDVCMVVRFGKAGDRLAYPTAAQVKDEYLQRWKSGRRY
jgi:hypothetical protein